MSFIPNMSSQRAVPGFGRTSAKIAIVGDYTSPFDDKVLRPFAGPGGNVLEACLHAAGLIRGDVYMTNCIKSVTKVPKKGKGKSKLGPCPDYFNESKGIFTDAGRDHVELLRKEVNGLDCNVIVACGQAAFVALCGLRAVSTYRGYVFPSIGLDRQIKVIPTFAPETTVWGMYTRRHIIVNDLKKAKAESLFPELNRPERQLVYDFANVEEALQWIEYFVDQPVVSFDIEVINYETACISFSSSPDLGVVIPIADTTFRPQGWTIDEELLIWRAIQRVVGNPNSIKILQNAIFDIHFLLTRNGIVTRGPIHDTMIGHSCMFPELPKGLGFLGSLYCGSQSYWKDTVKFVNIKDES